MSHDLAATEVKVSELPPIPGKRYFTIGEASKLCVVKPHVLRYWEQEFSQLKPVTRRGNRRYYQQNDIKMIRKIRSLLYEEGFTITGARHKLGRKGEGLSVKADISEVRRELETLLSFISK
ncbi:MAG: MerR family transcriptional regulator [Gammaproteobacteria bacterium]|jgi:DNA-binding transcriptional MerR regulator|nr:MerR family transcriptional regulator [Gammaproteobacteria bacterium]MBT7308722.1 MerR family transcriptional regulator [Gammaproteobacteria bacterium]